MPDNQNVEALWQNILSTLNKSPQDIRTVLQDGSAGKVWIHASASNNTVKIDKANEKMPSSTLRAPYHISQTEFIELYPIYHKWRAGTVSREYIRDNMSRKSSYIFALIHKFDDTVN